MTIIVRRTGRQISGTGAARRRAGRAISVMVAGLMAAGTAQGQEPDRDRGLGVYGGVDVSSLHDVADYRVGVQYVDRWFGRVDFYPGFAIIVAGRSSSWQALGALRVRPFGRIWYVGGGAVLQNGSFEQAVLSGFEIPLRGTHAFTELRLRGPIEHADGHLELLMGVGVGVP